MSPVTAATASHFTNARAKAALRSSTKMPPMPSALYIRTGKLYRPRPQKSTCHPISLVLPKETGVAPQRKTLRCESERFLRVFTGFQLSRALIPLSNEFPASPTVHCFACARGTTCTDRGGKGGRAPNKRRDKHPAPNYAKSVRGRALPARRISHARACQRGRRINVPFCPAKWDTLEKPV